MKKGKERIIYDNYDEDFEAVRQYLFEESDGDCDWEDAEDVSEEMVFEEMRLNYADAMETLKTFFDGSHKYLLKGTVTNWKGCFEAGFIFSTYNELTRAWKDCDYIKIYDVNGHLYIKCSHHDGTNYFEIKELTPRGEIYLDAAMLNTSIKDIHETLWDTNFLSKLPHFANRMYGVPKRQFKAA